MVASIAASAFLPALSSSTASMKALRAIGESLNTRGVAARTASSSGSMQMIRANAEAVPKINGTKADLISETLKTDASSSSAPGTFYNQSPDWSMLLASIITIFLASEKRRNWKPKRPDDAFGIGKIVQDGLTFRQNFSIRSNEIGADRTASIETLMNLLQETSLNHMKSVGFLDDGFGVTPEMSKRNLIWVVAKMHVLVDKYPSWRDVVQIDTWVKSSRKNGFRRDWHAIDCQTGETILRATSVFVLMNKQTRKLSKLADEVKAELGSLFIEQTAVIEEDCGKKVPKKLDDGTAHYVQNGLTPRWGDLDANKHVNNVKYIGWILESVPTSILESHQVAVMTLEYRRECRRESVLQSLTSVVAAGESPAAGMECVHLLRDKNGHEIVKGHTEWKPKRLPTGIIHA